MQFSQDGRLRQLFPASFGKSLTRAAAATSWTKKMTSWTCKDIIIIIMFFIIIILFPLELWDPCATGLLEVTRSACHFLTL